MSTSAAPAHLTRRSDTAARRLLGDGHAYGEIFGLLEQVQPKGLCLDVPAGEGANTPGIAAAGFRPVGGDLFPTPGALGEDGTPAPVVKADWYARLPFADNSFAAVLCSEGIEHHAAQTEFLRELARVLAPGGTLVITTPNVLSLGARVSTLFNGHHAHNRAPLTEVTQIWHDGAGRMPYIGHAYMVGYFALRFMLWRVGVRIERVATARWGRNSVLLAPLLWLPVSFGTRRVLRRIRRSHPDVHAEILAHRLLVVGRSSEGVKRATETASVLLSVSVPVGLGLLAVVVWLAVGRALRPVEEMRREASAITSSHLHARLAVPAGDDEIPRLASTLNDMLDRIDENHRLQRQFVSDASHELRSPLTTVRQLAEIARDYPDGRGAADLARDVLAEEQRMEELVAALLLLARLDDEDDRPDRDREADVVDLDDVILEEVRRARAVASQRQGTVRIDASGVGAAQVVAPPVLAAQVTRNLLSNAVRHARSQVLIDLRDEGDRAVLTVADDGNGIPPEERERVFERFVRLDESRTREQGGSGLGLAIVDKIVRRLGGDVEVGESRTGGAAFVVSLPLAAHGERDD